MIPPIPVYVDATSSPDGTEDIQVYNNTVGRVMAAGVASDDTTELMVYYNGDGDHGLGRALWVFVGGVLPHTSTLPSSLPSSGSVSPHLRRPLKRTPAIAVGPNPDDRARVYAPRIFDDFFTDEDRPHLGIDPGVPIGFEVVDAIVFHGLIVLAGAVYLYQPGPTGAPSWGPQGFGFVVSSDDGATWDLEYYDLDQPDSTEDPIARPYWPRGGPWVLKVAALYDQRANAQPSECYVVSSDYRQNVDPHQAHNGHAYVLKFTRNIESTPVGAWETDSGSIVRFTITRNTHVHVAHITEYQPGGESPTQGLQVVVSNGDGPGRARLVRYTIDDKDNVSFSDPDTWATQDDYHGTHDPFSRQLHGAFSMQPRSALQGPEANTIIWGADGDADLITLMSLPDDDGQCSIRHSYGFMTGRGLGVDPQNGQTPSYQATVDLEDIRPENNGQTAPKLVAPAIGWIGNENAQGDEGQKGSRIIYTPQVLAGPGRWTHVGAFPHISPSAMVYGGQIYTASNVDSSVGLRRRPAPGLSDIRRRRPILVAPGGKNMVHAACVWVNGPGPQDLLGTNSMMTAITGSTVSAGFTDSDPTPDRTLYPPCMCDQVYRLKSKLADRSGRAGEICISENGTPEDAIPWNTNPQVRRFRAWIMDGSFGQIAPNKTAQIVADFDPQGPENDRGAWIRYSCGWGADGEDRWCPVTLISYNDVRGGTRTLRIEFTSSGSRDRTDTNYVYVAIDQALDDVGSLAYPLPPTDGTSPTYSPDEKLTIEGLSIGKSDSWLVRVAGMVPTGNWDQYAMRGSTNSSGEYTSQKRWPLVTLWDDATHYIEISADCDNYGLVAQVKNGSGDPTRLFIGGAHVWLPDSPVYVAIGFDATANLLYVGFSLGGSTVNLTTQEIDLSGSNPFTELRFRGAPDEGHADGEVCEFRWFGGDANTDSTMVPTIDIIRAAFSDLAFLDPPPP